MHFHGCRKIINDAVRFRTRQTERKAMPTLLLQLLMLVGESKIMQLLLQMQSDGKKNTFSTSSASEDGD